MQDPDGDQPTIATAGRGGNSILTLPGGGMPARPVPAVPIPYHEPGRPSKAAGYSTQVDQIDAAGVRESVTLTGLDALLADDVIDDPLAGNYRLVDLDNILAGVNMEGLHNTTTFSFTSGAPGTVQVIPGSLFTDTRRVAGITAGDLNGDGQDEQIAAWVDADGNANWAIGEMPGLLGRITSPPAAVARPDGPSGGYALQFNGVDSYVEIPALDLSAHNTMAIEAWVKPDDITTNRYYSIVRQDGGSLPDWLLAFQEYGAVLSFGLSADGAYHELDVPIAPAAFVDGRWHRILATYDGVDQRLYVDGGEIGHQSKSGNIHFDPGASHWIGFFYDEVFNGTIDQVSFWNQVPTDTDLGLVARWPFDEGSGLETADATGTYTGTLTSGDMWISDNAPAGPIHLLVRGYDQALWHGICGADGDACHWSNAGGGLLASGPAVASRGSDAFDVFAIGVDTLVYQRHWNGNTWSGDWQMVDDEDYWIQASGMPTRALSMPADVSAPAAVARGAGQIDLFRQAPDNTLRWRHFDGSGWGAWQKKLGGMLASAPGAVSLNDNHMQVFARGVDEAMWTLTYDNGWGTWQRIERDGMPVTVTIASAPTAVSPAPGQIAVYVRGSDDRLWEIQGNGATWGTWQSLDQGLASGVGVAVWDGERELFARAADGSLQRKHFNGATWSNWQNGGGLRACCQASPADFTWSESHSDIPNAGLDVTTGHFTGDGRSQIVVAYLGADSKVRIGLYDVQNGFEPTLLTKVVLEVADPLTEHHLADAVYVSAGDFYTGGVDEIAVLYRWTPEPNVYAVQFFDVVAGSSTDGVPWSIVEKGEPKTRQADWDNRNRWMHFDMASGDLNGDGDEEVAVAAMTRWHNNTDWWWWLQILDAGAGGPVERDVGQFEVAIGDDNGAWVCRGCLELETGNLDAVPGNGDEIVVTWVHPVSAENIDHRYIEVFTITNTWEMELQATHDLSGETMVKVGQSDALAVGDFNRDLQDEIAYYYATWPTAVSCLQHLGVYRYDPGGIESLASSQEAAASWNGAELISGSFTGESLRVGPPSYRVQNEMNTPLVFLNMPPKHRDLIRQPDGSYDPLEIRVDDETSVTYGRMSGQETLMSTQSERSWSLTAGFETKVGSGAYAKASFDSTYGENFKDAITKASLFTFDREIEAANNDVIYYDGTDYEVWEYPVYDDDGEEPAGYITVQFPILQNNTTNQPRDTIGTLCDPAWYAPRHQPFNMWSYDPIGGDMFDDFGELLVGFDTGGCETSWELQLTGKTEQQRSSESYHSFNAGLEVGFESDDIPLFGWAVPFDFKAYVNGEYEGRSMQTHTTVCEETTALSGSFSELDLSEAVTVRPVLYKAKAGYLVLDYQTAPNTGQAAWGIWKQKADPGFILPFYGYPHPDPATYRDTPCADKEMRLFSHDVAIDPPFASVGDTVTISATVHNFSEKGIAGPLTVRFYQGYPAADDSNQIGADRTIDLGGSWGRYDGPQTVSTTWEASGTGEQKIYVVIDPEDQLDEVHDGSDISYIDSREVGIDNNMAYGTIQVGAADYLDPGTVGQKVYQVLEYKHSDSLTLSASAPTTGFGETTRLELSVTSIQGVSAVGEPFSLEAYQGSASRGWQEPIPDFDLTPDAGTPPVVITLAYGDADMAARDEVELQLYRLTHSGWVTATCADYEVYRFPEDNLLFVPVCQTSVFAFSDGSPIPVPYNRAPYAPYAPIPADGATKVPITQILHWQGGDPDGDPVSYAIALGTSDPPPHVATTSLTQYTPALSAGKTYYWAIQASDGTTTTVGQTWSFSVVETKHVYLPLVVRRSQ